MIVYIVAAAVIVAFAASLWRKYQQGEEWRRDLSFFVDLAAMGVTALVVGSLAFVQLRTPVAGAEEETVMAAPTATATVTARATRARTTATAARATRTPRRTATRVVESTTSASSEDEGTVTPTLTPQPEEDVTATAVVSETATVEATPTETATLEPTAPPPTATAARTSFNYTVVAGDTVSIIARRFGVTSEQIVAANPGLDSDRLSIDQVLVIPAAGGTTPAAPPAPAFTNYSVQAGDVLSVIARDQGVTVAALLAANPGLNEDSTLQIGQVIRIPR